MRRAGLSWRFRRGMKPNRSSVILAALLCGNLQASAGESSDTGRSSARSRDWGSSTSQGRLPQLQGSAVLVDPQLRESYNKASQDSINRMRERYSSGKRPANVEEPSAR